MSVCSVACVSSHQTFACEVASIMHAWMHALLLLIINLLLLNSQAKFVRVDVDWWARNEGKIDSAFAAPGLYPKARLKCAHIDLDTHHR